MKRRGGQTDGLDDLLGYYGISVNTDFVTAQLPQRVHLCCASALTSVGCVHSEAVAQDARRTFSLPARLAIQGLCLAAEARSTQQSILQPLAAAAGRDLPNSSGAHGRNCYTLQQTGANQWWV